MSADDPQGSSLPSPLSAVDSEARYGDLRVRPIQPGDADALRQAFEHWSQHSRYLRFHTGMHHLSDHVLEYLTQVDGVNHVALVATLAGEPEVGVGVGRFVKLVDDAHRADLALAVTDDAQGHGVARTLLLALAQAAAERGVEVFCMDVLGSNTHVRELLNGLGARCVRCEEGILNYELPIATLQAAATESSFARELEAALRTPSSR